MEHSNPKPRSQSKTHWFNALMMVLLAAEANLHILQPLLPVNSFSVISFVLIIVNLVLRELTTQPLASKKEIERARL